MSRFRTVCVKQYLFGTFQNWIVSSANIRQIGDNFDIRRDSGGFNTPAIGTDIVLNRHLNCAAIR